MTSSTDDRSAKVTLPADDQILIVREFDARADLVYRAWTTPSLISRWYGGRHGEVRSADVDLRIGGSWRYVLFDAERGESAFSGSYREIDPGRRLVTTEVFEGAPEVESVNTITFTEADGRTTFEMLVQHADKSNRDAVLEAGIEMGIDQVLDSLASLLRAIEEESR